MSWTYKGEKRPVSLCNTSSLFLIYCLKKVLPELVTVGLSASTGLLFVGHAINSWEFKLQFWKQRKKVERKRSLIVVVLFFILLAGVGISWYLMWKSENKRNANGQHEPISVNADLERIALPIRFSYQELVATTGSFEIVESSVKEGLDKFIKKPWVVLAY